MVRSQPVGNSVCVAETSLPLQKVDSAIEPNGNTAFEQALLYALQAMRFGDFSIRLPGDQMGLQGKIADTFNDIVAAKVDSAIEPCRKVAFEQALLYALQAMRFGDFSIRLPGDQTGLQGKIADTFNDIVAAKVDSAIEPSGNAA